MHRSHLPLCRSASSRLQALLVGPDISVAVHEDIPWTKRVGKVGRNRARVR